MRGTADACDEAGFTFLPFVVESFGGFQKVAVQQAKKIGSDLARHTGIPESEAIQHFSVRCTILIQKGLSALTLNRIPTQPTAANGGQF